MIGNEGTILRRQSTHSAGYRDTGSMIQRHHYFEFDVNNTQVISGQFSTVAGKSVSIDWGDGSTRSTYSGTDQAWSKDYGSAGNRTVRIFGSVVLTKFKMDAAGANISFDAANLPTGLTYLAVYGSNTLSGDITNLPVGLTYLNVSGNNSLTGDITNLPTGLTFIYMNGNNSLTGDIANLPTGLTFIYINGNNILTGDIANLPTGLTFMSVTGNNSLTGNITNLPVGLTYLKVYGSNTLSGDITNLPIGLTSLSVGGNNSLTGAITNLPTGLTSISMNGNNSLTGDIANLPTGVTSLYIGGSNTIADYTGKAWTSRPSRFSLSPVGAGGLSEAEIDQLFIDFDDDFVWASGNVISLTGTNAAPSAASAAARTNIANEGCTITTN